MFRTGLKDMCTPLMDHNLEIIRKTGIKTVVFSCSGCYSTFGHEYVEYTNDNLGFDLYHMTQFVPYWAKKKGLKIKYPNYSKENPLLVTYHDPCHLGRHGQIFNAPREILKAIPGITLVEMNRTREYSFCCGGGGGARTGKLDFAMATARRRIEEAEKTGAELLATACPFCEQNFTDFIDGEGSVLDLVDVVSLLKRSVFGEQEKKKTKKKQAG